MIWTKIKRVCKAGFVNFWRNGFVSLSSVLVMSVTLFVIGGTIFSSALLQGSLDQIKDKVDVNVYFTTSAPEGDILALQKSLKSLPEVAEVTYMSRTQALEDFKKRHADDQLTLQALDELGDNPLGAVLNIKAKNPSEYEGIATFLKGKLALADGSSGIDKVNYYQNKVAIDRLAKLIDGSEKIGLAVAVLLCLISVIIAFNTIRLIIYISKEEISVMKLVGASNKYVRGPFMVSGVLYGFASSVLTLIIFFPLTRWLGTASANFFSGINVFSYYLAHFGQFVLILVGTGVVLGAISSALAVTRYLKV